MTAKATADAGFGVNAASNVRDVSSFVIGGAL